MSEHWAEDEDESLPRRATATLLVLLAGCAAALIWVVVILASLGGS